jgi:hypothetical protein
MTGKEAIEVQLGCGVENAEDQAGAFGCWQWFQA